jgi:hypothetical protein
MTSSGVCPTASFCCSTNVPFPRPAEGDRPRRPVGGIELLRLQRAVAVAEQHADGIAAVVGGHDVRISVAVEVGDDAGGRRHARGERALRGERAVADPEQDAERGVVVVRHGEIRLQVAVEVADRHGHGPGPGGERPLLPKATIARPEQHAHRVAEVVGRCQVELAVGVEVGDGHGTGRGAAGERPLRLERAVAPAEQHPHGVVEVVGRDQVGLAIAVDVADRHRDRTGAGRQFPGRRGERHGGGAAQRIARRVTDTPVVDEIQADRAGAGDSGGGDLIGGAAAGEGDGRRRGHPGEHELEIGGIDAGHRLAERDIPGAGRRVRGGIDEADRLDEGQRIGSQHPTRFQELETIGRGRPLSPPRGIRSPFTSWPHLFSTPSCRHGEDHGTRRPVAGRRRSAARPSVLRFYASCGRNSRFRRLLECSAAAPGSPDRP